MNLELGWTLLLTGAAFAVAGGSIRILAAEGGYADQVGAGVAGIGVGFVVASIAVAIGKYLRRESR